MPGATENSLTIEAYLAIKVKHTEVRNLTLGNQMTGIKKQKFSDFFNVFVLEDWYDPNSQLNLNANRAYWEWTDCQFRSMRNASIEDSGDLSPDESSAFDNSIRYVVLVIVCVCVCVG